MAAISITPADMITVSGNTTIGTAGETVAAGQTCYLKSSDGLFWLADCAAAAVTGQVGINVVRGVAMNSATVSQPLTIQIDGSINVGVSVTEGLVIYQSPTPGSITETIADIVTGVWITIIGVATSTSVIELDIKKYEAQGQ